MDGLFSKPRDFQLLSKIFSRNVITEFAKQHHSPTLDSILNELKLDKEHLSGVSISNFFEDSYNELIKNYRNEYVFKNAIAEKIVRGKHRLSNTTFVTEFKVGNSIADVAVFNGTSTAYEIKTEYDSFERLDSQLSEYKKVFDKTYVVVPASKTKKLLNIVPEYVGVYELTDRYSLSLIKKASSNVDDLCLKQMLNSMRPSECLELIEKKFGYTPAKSPSQRKKDCIDIFCELDNDSAHKAFVSVLKARKLENYEKNIIKQLPRSLTSLILSLRLNKKLLLNFHTCIMENHSI